MTRIESITATAIAIERRMTLTTAHGARNDANTVLIEMRTDDGLTGLGQAPVDQPYYGETAEGMLVNIRRYLAPALIGQDPFDIERQNASLRRTLPGHPASQAALEMALWDIKGKALNVPVYQLLGGKIRPGIPIMGSLTHASPEAMAAEADEILNSSSYDRIKMKVGLRPLDDVARYRAVRSAVGDRANLQVDGNAGYTFGDALIALTSMIEIGNLVMVDQPVARLDDMAELASRLPIPLMADEAIDDPASALDIVNMRAASAGFIKIAKQGGLLNVAKIAALFEAAGLSISMGIYYDVIAAASAHLAAALPAVIWPSPFTHLNGAILAEPLVPEGTWLRVPERPGLGVELDPDAVRAHALDI